MQNLHSLIFLCDIANFYKKTQNRKFKIRSNVTCLNIIIFTLITTGNLNYPSIIGKKVKVKWCGFRKLKHLIQCLKLMLKIFFTANVTSLLTFTSNCRKSTIRLVTPNLHISTTRWLLLCKSSFIWCNSSTSVSMGSIW